MHLTNRALPILLLVLLNTALFLAPSQSQPPTPLPATPLLPHIAKVQVLEQKCSSPNGKECKFSLGNTLVVILDKDNLAPLKKLETPTKPIGLFFNGLFMLDIPAHPEPNNPDALRFQLQYTSANRDAWSQLFGRKSSGSEQAEKVWVTVGLSDGSVVAINAQTLHLELFYGNLWTLSIWALAIILVAGTVVLGIRTPMLRDRGAPGTGSLRGTYSLGRIQMALWFLTIVVSFLFILAVTGVAPPITQGALVLMGISAATALGAVAIDENKRTASRNDLVREQVALQTQTQELTRQITAAPDDPNLAVWKAQQQVAQARLLQIPTQLAQTAVPQAAVSEGLINDLLTDNNGISFHRLQIVAWTLVLWFLFLWSVIGKLTMVDFDNTQLALLGISGGTYLGFKLNEE